VAIDKTPIIADAPQSISAAMQGLALAEDHELLPVGNTAALNKGSQPPIPLVQKPKPKPKPRHKTKAGAGADFLGDAAAEDIIAVRRSGRLKK
jgi:hypothetical protein